jgi:hypothetical protein
MKNRVTIKTLFAVVLFAGFFIANAQTADYKTLRGVATSAKTGAPISGALVVLASKMVYTLTDVAGAYSFANGGIKIISTPITTHPGTTEYSQLSVKKGVVSFTLLKQTRVKLDLYDLRGRLIITSINKKLESGLYAIRIGTASPANQLYILRTTFGTVSGSFKFIPSQTTQSFMINKQTTATEPPLATRSNRPIDVVRISDPGSKTKIIPLDNYTAPADAVLDTLNSQYGNPSLVDGSFDRMMVFGKAKYFWGINDLGDTIPMVKSITALTDKAVDYALIFNTHFVDNTYGKNIIGWKTNGHGHTYEMLVKSDHVWLGALNKNKDTVFSGKIDYISAIDTAKIPSGYTCLGPYGGDGALYKGQKSDIVSFGSSLDNNVNYYGYRLFVDSPKTDSLYTPNPDYPFWEYYVIYRITFKASAFGGKDNYGNIVMQSVHASPSKYEDDTVIIFETIHPIIINPFIQVISVVIPDIDK